MKTLLTFTGGGLAPALNPTLYGVITKAREKGWRVLGGLYGWASLLRNGRHINLTGLNIESLKENGGTILRSSRTNPYATEDGPDQVRENIKTLGLDAIIAIGGDDTLKAAAKLAANGLPIVGIPKTVDNDLPGTYFSPGFPSAAYYLANFTDEIKRDAAYALSRIFIIEAPGMKAGWLTCAGALGGADLTLPPEWELSWPQVLGRISQCYENNGNYAAIMVSQTARFDSDIKALDDQQIGEQHGHKRQSFICLDLRDRIRAELGVDAKALYPGNFIETGRPIAIDRDCAIKLGNKAIEIIEQGAFGQMVCITRPDLLQTNLVIATIPLSEIINLSYHPLESDMFDQQTLRPTKKFFGYMAPFAIDISPQKNSDYDQLIQKITKGTTNL